MSRFLQPQLRRRGGGAAGPSGTAAGTARTPGGARARAAADAGQAARPHPGNAAAAMNRAVVARQKLFAIWGQIQTYAFQIELLKRCDPEVGSRSLRGLKLNALMVRYLMAELGPGLEEQAEMRLTPLTYGLWLAIRRVKDEGEALIAAFADYVVRRDAREFFARAMNLAGPCPYHVDVVLETYGGSVSAGVKFLHDAENVIKQLNYCHLIVRATDAAAFLKRLDAFMLLTVGSGSIVPPELYDPSHPCAVCFEELCVTANRGESARRRVAGKICDHITRQTRVRGSADEMATHLPHASSIPPEKRSAALAALERLEDDVARRDTVDGGSNGQGLSVHAAADAALDAHNVFLPASSRLYAVSELKFWISSSGRQSGSGGSDGSTVDAFAENLDALVEREKAFDIRAAIVETVAFGKRQRHFEREYDGELGAMSVVDRLMLGGRAVSPDDLIEALIKACYDHHLSAPLLKRLADPERAAEEALKRVLERATVPGANHASASSERPSTSAGGDGLGDRSNGDDNDRDANDSGDLRMREDLRCDADIADSREGWLDLVRAAASDAIKRRKMYADRLTKRSMASLDRCVTEQRHELEKTLRINVYGEVLLDTYVAAYNGFRSRVGVLSLAGHPEANIVDNRTWADAFDAHRFMMTSLLRRKVDPAMLPSLTHKFFQLVNGPIFDHDRHTFAQPPNTALYFSVENVGLLPHLKEELAKFMLNSGGSGGWTVSRFRGFYDFSGAEGVTAAQRLAWKYIKELILAAALFSSVFRCGELRVRRADSTGVDGEGEQLCKDGIYITYETDCPLMAVLGADRDGRIGPDTTVILDSDVFSLLYAVLQRLAPGTAERARAEAESEAQGNAND
ncbi:DNA packaging terminase subunit 2 [Falconid herpesvirus 1]|uniref:DNA packaging terminase subunit 2 n=1 Tax=Falconid herpesvirus 1 TaxID=1510155 RepID=A0A068ER29_9ALPH|nr:DNA packaging terminase subunit 2 [Falconid herpesvirus 1]AID52732.1 DNA packaging terminase subunit 2 [Falconid herpesvirus 1]